MASLWFYQAAAGSTAFLLTSALLPTWEWHGIDLASTMLNVSGSIMAGLANGGAADNDKKDVETATAIFVDGFLSVWTSMAFSMEHAAHLALVHDSLWRGVAYLVGSVVLGVALYDAFFRIGRHWRVSSTAVDYARGPLSVFTGFERSALVTTVAVAAGLGWAMGQPPDRLSWGIAMATLGGVVGNWCSSVGGSDGRIKWGNWRCNTLSFVGVVTAHRAVALMASKDQRAILDSAFFGALVSEGFGTISGFSALASDAGGLALEGDYMAAAGNILINVLSAVVALLGRMKAEEAETEAVGI